MVARKETFMNAKLQAYLDKYLKQPRMGAVSFKRARQSVASECSSIDKNLMDYECFDMAACAPSIDAFIDKNKDVSFQTKLFKFIDDKNLKDSDVYNKVNIDRRLFSKIRNEDYHPSKETVILLGLSLELTEQEIEDLLKSASYSLPMNTTYDLIIRFCFKEHIYDINQVNEFLYDYKCKTLN
jgi:hypothetical protein